MAMKIKASKQQRNDAKDYIKLHLREYLEREGINPRNNFCCLNPDHNDEHGDMSYHVRSNSCVCHCGARYDTFDIIGIEYGLTSFEEKFVKGCEIFGLLGQCESEDSLKVPDEWRKNIPEYELPDRASDEKCSAYYYALTKCKETKLQEKHKADLLRRGLTEDDIKRFRFCSVPEAFLDAKKAAGEASIEAGKRLGTIDGCFPNKVPGFYLGERGWNIVNNSYGYYCPVFNGEKNQIVGFQIRLDQPVRRRKYTWFSSTNKTEGTSSGAPSTILPGKNQKIWIITEGILKALVIYCLLNKEISVIGVPGVDSLGGLKSFIEERGDSDLVFIEAYDMDKLEKDAKGVEKAVAKAQRKLWSLVTESGFAMHTLQWDLDKKGKWAHKYKGLDDFLVEYVKEDGNREKFIRYLIRIREELLKPQLKKIA